MTDASDLPEDVRALIHEHIESYEHLETLLLLRRGRHEQWTTESVAARLRVRPELIAAALASLEASGLVEATNASPTLFAYRAVSSALDTAVERLEREYADRPILIIQLMSANSIERLRTAALHTFADAFVLNKKDKGRG